MAKAIRIIEQEGVAYQPKKAAVFLFDDDQDSETCNVTVEMVGMSGRDLHLLVESAISLGEKLGMFGGADYADPSEDDNAGFNMVGF